MGCLLRTSYHGLLFIGGIGRNQIPQKGWAKKVIIRILLLQTIIRKKLRLIKVIFPKKEGPF